MAGELEGALDRGLVVVCDVDLGGADATKVHTVEVVRWLAEAAPETDLVARGPDPQIPRVRYHAATVGLPGPVARALAANRTALSLLWRRRRAASYLYIRHDWALAPTLVAARLLGYRIVAQVDDVEYGPGYARLPGAAAVVRDAVRRVAARLLGLTGARVVAVGHGIARLLTQHFGVAEHNVRVIFNGVDPDLFAPLPRDEAVARSGLDPDGEYVVFIGLLAEWVAVETMVRGFAAAARTRPDARLVVVGDGPERPLAERLAHELGVADSVVFAGFVSERRRVADYVGAATVCLVAYKAVFRARTGATPVKLPEYLAAGRAVVGIGMPGISEMLEESGGGVTVSDDPEELGAAIAELLADPQRADALGAAGRRAAVERYSWRSVVERTLPLFR
ncbi:MAG TPA: glycosyltransferase [Gaiellaceae bacterium]|nr:glycosyltransferase [Gaiellaceae bacterium]